MLEYAKFSITSQCAGLATSPEIQLKMAFQEGVAARCGGTHL
jgi:hypothetical protein